MKKTIYVKYNSQRKKSYRVSVAIQQDGLCKYVEKKAIVPEAVSHINRIEENARNLPEVYENLTFLSCERIDENTIRFPYLEGDPLLTEWNKEQCLQTLSEVLNFKKERVQPFFQTTDFLNIFGNYDFDGLDSIQGAVFDSDFDNFKRIDHKLICFDYEWVFDFPVPIEFLRYRTLFYYYQQIKQQLLPEMSEMEFLKEMGIEAERVEIYAEMEKRFQQYVYVQGQSGGYFPNYGRTKAVVQNQLANEELLVEQQKVIHARDEQIQGRDEQIARMEQDIVLAEQERAKREELLVEQQKVIHARDEQIEGMLKEQRAFVYRQMEQEASDEEKLKEQHSSEIAQLNQKINELGRSLQEEGRIANEEQATIQRLNQEIWNLKRAIRNPIYGVSLAEKKLRNRAERKKLQQNAGESSQMPQEKQDFRTEERKILDARYQDTYGKWIRNLEKQSSHEETFTNQPLISVLVPVYNVSDRYLRECIESVQDQIYPNWELILVDDCSSRTETRTFLHTYEGKDSRIHIFFREKNGGISAATNTALQQAKGDFIGFLDCDDTLSPDALYEVVKLLNQQKDLDLIYSDEDKITEDSEDRHMPNFKPDWSPDTMLCYMYTCHFSVYRTSLAREIGGLNSRYDGAQDYDFALRFTEKTSRIGHIPKILYHWRESSGSTAGDEKAKPYVRKATIGCREEALRRRGIEGKLEAVPETSQFRVVYPVQGEPLVSVIIPSKDNPMVLKRCVESLRKLTSYPHYELIVVDNGSTPDNRLRYEALAEADQFQYLYHPEPFNFSHMCNFGADHAAGDFYLFLNDDIEIFQAEWLERMLGEAQQDHVGAVGAKLYYPDSTLIQHAGVINIKSGPSHCFSHMDDRKIYYFWRNRMDYDLLAVTGACLLVNREKFREIGGFREELPVSYNDVDLCFQLIEKGYYNVIRNDAVLYHHESLSRGSDLEDPKKLKRLNQEKALLYQYHSAFQYRDPFYSPHLNQNGVEFNYNFDEGVDFSVREIGTEEQSFGTDKTVNPRTVLQNEIDYNIDGLFRDDTVILNGWAFICGSNQNADADVIILLNDGKITYQAHTKRILREDVCQIHPQEKNIDYCGFRARICPEQIQDGIYQVGIQIQGKKIWTNEQMVKSGEKIHLMAQIDRSRENG